MTKSVKLTQTNKVNCKTIYLAELVFAIHKYCYDMKYMDISQKYISNGGLYAQPKRNVS